MCHGGEEFCKNLQNHQLKHRTTRQGECCTKNKTKQKQNRKDKENDTFMTSEAGFMLLH